MALTCRALNCCNRSRGTAGVIVNRRVGPPLVEVMRLDDRDCVFFLPHDISCALENQGGVQCVGYSTVDSAKIGINLVLYALTQ